MKDDVNFPHNGGGVVYLLQSVAIHLNLTVYTKVFFLQGVFMYTKSLKKSFLRKEYIYIIITNTESSLEQ